MQYALAKITISTIVLAVNIILSTRPTPAAPASALQATLNQLRKKLPEGMVMRLPAYLETMVSEGKPTQLYPLQPDTTKGVNIALTMQPGCDNLGCLWGYIAAYPANSSHIDTNFRKNLNLSLGNGVRANYYEKGCGYYDPRIGRGSFRRITWEQDRTVFVTQEGCHSDPKLDSKAKQMLIARASSMASEPPIQSYYNAQYYKEQGDAHYDRRSWQQAISAYTEAITLSPRYTALYYNRGMAHYHSGQKQQAIADLQKAAQLYQEQRKPKDRQESLNMIRKIQSGG